MRIVVFTATRQAGGLGETFESLCRQQGASVDYELLWIVGDELYDRRPSVLSDVMWAEHFDTAHYRVDAPEIRRTLARAYNSAITRARWAEADLFVSLQDYVVPPDDGVERFIEMARRRPDCLLTGLTSFSTQPTVDQVFDIDDPWTIFGNVYMCRPPQDGWRDGRESHGPGYHDVPAIEWETNWAAIPRSILYDERLRFDEDYDYAVAYENSDYAAQATSLGYGVVLDCDNHAVGFPHRDYWPEQEVEEAPLTLLNRGRFERKWLS